MKKIILFVVLLFFIILIFIIGFNIKTGNNIQEDLFSENSLANQQDLAPEGFTYDGENFWTTHEPGWEIEDEIKPGNLKFQAYLFKHSNNKDKSIIESYAFPHNYNVIGMVFINGELWTSSWINSNLGRIYRYKIENKQLIETGSWDTTISCDGLIWDGSFLWCNMGSWEGIRKYDITNGLNLVKKYELPPEIKALEGEGVNPKGIAWDGKNIWTAYKETEPIIVKHNMDDKLSFAEGYSYSNEKLNYHPGGIVFVDRVLYSSSSDPGTLDLRGGRIVKHKIENNTLLIDKIWYYNTYK